MKGRVWVIYMCVHVRMFERTSTRMSRYLSVYLPIYLRVYQCVYLSGYIVASYLYPCYPLAPTAGIATTTRFHRVGDASVVECAVAVDSGSHIDYAY